LITLDQECGSFKKKREQSSADYADYADFYSERGTSPTL
jgi:hypothetical protein